MFPCKTHVHLPNTYQKPCPAFFLNPDLPICWVRVVCFVPDGEKKKARHDEIWWYPNLPSLGPRILPIGILTIRWQVSGRLDDVVHFLTTVFSLEAKFAQFGRPHDSIFSIARDIAMDLDS